MNIGLGIGINTDLIVNQIRRLSLPQLPQLLWVFNKLNDLQSAFFERHSSATVVSYNGVFDVQIGEARFEGARRVENLAKNTNTVARDRTNIDGLWTYTENEPDHQGTNTAISASTNSASTRILLNSTIQSKQGLELNGSLWMKAEVPMVVDAAVTDVFARGFNTSYKSLNVTTTWQRFSLDSDFSVVPSPQAVGIMLRPHTANKKIYFAFKQIEHVVGQSNKIPSEFTLPQWENTDGLDFDGGGDCVDLGNNHITFNTDNGFTIVADITHRGQIGNGIILGFAIYETNSQYIQLSLVNDQIQLSYRDDNASERFFIAPTPLLTGKFYSIVASRNTGNEIKIDINETIYTTTDTTPVGVTQTSASSYYDSIGAWRNSGQFFFGKIENVRFYDAVKTRDALDANNLIGQWNFDEAEGHVVYDTSGNNNHGYLTSFQLFPKYYGTENGNTVDENGVVTEATGVMLSESTLKGILIEEQRMNLLRYSEEFHQSVWTKGDSSITPNVAIAPDGTMTADKEETTIASNPNVYQNLPSFTPNVPYTGSVYIKGGNINQAAVQLYRNGGGVVIHDSAQILFGPGTVSGVGSSAIYVSGLSSTEWTRVAFTGTPEAEGVLNINIKPRLSGTTVGDYNYIWGAQLEQGTFATSYIPTGGTTVTRDADILQYNQLGAGNFPQEFSITMAMTPLADGTDYNDDDMRLFGTDDSRGINNQITTIGDTTYDFSDNIFHIDKHEILHGTKSSFGFYVAQDGANIRAIIIKDGVEKLNTTVAGTLDHSNTGILQIGNWNGHYFSGKYKNIRLYGGALNTSQLQQLTL